MSSSTFAPASAVPSAAASATEPATSPALEARERRIYRHRLPVRVMHWINVTCFFILLMSGLQIFNAHPALYWGQGSDFAAPWLLIGARQTPDGPQGVTRIGGHSFPTGGVLGTSKAAGTVEVRAFPAWATVPGPQWLAMGRRWHFFFAWIFVVNGASYLLYTIFSRHLTRDLWPSAADRRRIGRSIRDHLLLRHPAGDAEARYNVLQKIAYLVVIFGLLPLVVLCGIGMSPRLDTVFGGWVGWLGGRQSARSLHFIAAFGLLLFVLIHVFEVFVNGVWNQLRSMITGHYTVHTASKEKA